MKLFLKAALLRNYSLQSEMARTLLLSCLFSVALTAVRVAYTGQGLFLFLIWNLFLAFIPYAITTALTRHIHWIESKGRFAVAFAAWLLTIPNAFYIITDLFHLEARHRVPLWFDLALLLSFAWNGLLLGVLSVRQMKMVLQAKWKVRSDWLFVYPVMALNALGVYIGRYLRFNSWDVLTQPFSLAEEVLYLFVHPLRNRFDWGMIGCYAVLLSLMYTTIKRMGKTVW